MIVRRHNAPCTGADRVLLVMLTGAGMVADDFAAHGLVAELHRRRLAVDVAAVQPELDLYLEGGIAAALQQAVIAPALAQGYARLWLLGVSMGGMGALLYAAAGLAEIEQLVLLAPFLGTKGTIAELGTAGGIAAWCPTASGATTPEIDMLTWLRDASPRPTLYLGFGEQDRFAPGHRLLAATLPPDRVLVSPGGHDWPTWCALWARTLDKLDATRPVA